MRIKCLDAHTALRVSVGIIVSTMQVAAIDDVNIYHTEL